MNATVETILRRRSVREGFSREPIPQAVLEDVLRCGLSAPSSKNARPWCFHVVTEPALRHELARVVEGAEGIERYVPVDPATGKPRPHLTSSVLESAAAIRLAPVAIFVENTGVFSRGRETLLGASAEVQAASIIGYTLEVLGVGAAVENMWIAAIGHGLAGVFMGDILIAERALRKRLGISCDLLGVLVLGYPERPLAARFSAAADLDDEHVRWIWPT